MAIQSLDGLHEFAWAWTVDMGPGRKAEQGITKGRVRSLWMDWVYTAASRHEFAEIRDVAIGKA